MAEPPTYLAWSLWGRRHKFSNLSGVDVCHHHKWPNDSIDATCGKPEDHPVHSDLCAVTWGECLARPGWSHVCGQEHWAHEGDHLCSACGALWVAAILAGKV